MRHAFGAARYLLRVVRLRLADRCAERRREAPPREIRHQQTGSAAIFYAQPYDFEAEREVERSDDHQRGASIPDSAEGCMPCAVERELGEVKSPCLGRGSRVDTPPRDRDREIQRRPHRPERGGRRRPWRLTASFVDGRAFREASPPNPAAAATGKTAKPTRPTSTPHSFPFEPGPAPMERDRIRDKGSRPGPSRAHARVTYGQVSDRGVTSDLLFTRYARSLESLATSLSVG